MGIVAVAPFSNVMISVPLYETPLIDPCGTDVEMLHHHNIYFQTMVPQ